MAKCSFSERTYEFCFNAEFCNRYKGLLAAHPTLPSQRQEEHLGYDVDFKIKNGSYSYSIFLQHKVSNYASTRVSNNKNFYNTHSGPYFRFRVNTEQHNKMIDNHFLGDIFYSVPLFNTYSEIKNHYDKNDIVNSSIWIYHNNLRITDNRGHNITYDPNGTCAYLHSEPKQLKVFQPSEPNINLTKKEINAQFIKEVLDGLEESIADTKYIDIYKSNHQYKGLKDIEKIQHILGNIYKGSWILM